MVDATPVDLRPRHVEFTGDGAQLWVAAEVGGTVQIVDAASRKVVETLHFAIPGVADHRILPCGIRSEEHTSELQSLMRISYAVFCLKKKKKKYTALQIKDYI